MLYNWAGCLLLVSDESAPLIHSCAASFDGTCFNHCLAIPKLISNPVYSNEAFFLTDNTMPKRESLQSWLKHACKGQEGSLTSEQNKVFVWAENSGEVKRA